MKFAISTFTIALALSLCAILNTSGQNAPAGIPPRPVWEYRILGQADISKLIATRNFDKLFNDLGAEGWELVAVQDQGEVYYFKRQK